MFSPFHSSISRCCQATTSSFKFFTLTLSPSRSLTSKRESFLKATHHGCCGRWMNTHTYVFPRHSSPARIMTPNRGTIYRRHRVRRPPSIISLMYVVFIHSLLLIRLVDPFVCLIPFPLSFSLSLFLRLQILSAVKRDSIRLTSRQFLVPSGTEFPLRLHRFYYPVPLLLSVIPVHTFQYFLLEIFVNEKSIVLQNVVVSTAEITSIISRIHIVYVSA